MTLSTDDRLAIHELISLRELWVAAPGDQPVGHHVTNVIVTERDGEVRVRSKGLSVMSTGAAGTVVYDDVVVKTADGWRISSSRKVVARPSRSTS